MGVVQCINWGVLYYSYGALVMPIQADLLLSPSAATGAFSLALLVSAICAPTVGRLIDRGHSERIMKAAGMTAAVVLFACSLASNLWYLYLCWAVLGVCMAAMFYEPAFAVVTRGVAEPSLRLQALATLTIVGGLASSVFIPLTSVLTGAFGWRAALRGLALPLVFATYLMPARPHSSPLLACDARRASTPLPTPGRRLHLIAAMFAAGTAASAALALNLVPMLVDRGFPVEAAAGLAALQGVMQLPSRILVRTGQIRVLPQRLLVVTFACQAAGFALLGVSRNALVTGAAISAVAFGTGLATIARPHVLAAWFGLLESGRANGVVASAQNYARAAAPMVIALLAGAAGSQAAFLGFAAMLLAASLLAAVPVSSGRVAE